MQVTTIGSENFDGYVVLGPHVHVEAGTVVEAPFGFLSPDLVMPMLSIGTKFTMWAPRAPHAVVFAEVEVLEITEGGKRFQATEGEST